MRGMWRFPSEGVDGEEHDDDSGRQKKDLESLLVYPTIMKLPIFSLLLKL